MGSINVNGLSTLKEVENFDGGWLDFIGLRETYIEGCGVIDCMIESESEVWEGIDGR